jgi:hypothetical protein
MSTSLPTRVAIPPAVLFQELEGECVLLNLDTERYYSLDDVGTRMWQLLAEHGDVATVVEQLLAEYDVDEATLRQDLVDLIGKLSEAGLVTIG